MTKKIEKEYRFVYVNDKQYKYSIVHKPNLRACHLTTNKKNNNEIQVTAPRFISNTYIDSWVIKCLEKKSINIGAQPIQIINLKENYLLIQNKKYDIKYIKSIKRKYLILNSTIYFYINKEEDKKYLIKKFYIEMSELYFTPNVEKWAKTMGIKYNKIQYKNVFSKLGSCDTHGNLIFSSWLVALDLKIYSSIIVHELAHTLQMNHSKKFYEIVYKYMPDYDNLQKEISKYSIVY